jgi:hypothetical protein
MKRRARNWLRERAFASRTASRLRRRRHVLCLGDSHVGVFGQVTLPGVWFRVVQVRGATASGIQNPNSSTDARRRFEAALARAKAWQHVLVNLGEVDCNFIVWRRAEKTGSTVARQLATTLDSYERFLAEVCAGGFASVTVLSATLPTIEDYQTLGERFPDFDPEILGFRRQIRVAFEDRLRLTREFNEDLAARCERLGIAFVDTTSLQLDPRTNRVRTELLVPDKPNIHLHGPSYAGLLGRVFAEREFCAR